MKITKTVVDKLLVPEKGQKLYRDDLLIGFGVRVTATGSKAFFVEKRINGRSRRKTLGAYGHLTVSQARDLAQKFLGQVASGTDPLEVARVDQSRQIKLSEVFEEYLLVRKGLKPNTVFDYRRLMREAFADWQNKPMISISKDAIAKRHTKLGERSHARANNAMRLMRALFNFANGQYEDSEGKSLFIDNPVKRLSHTRAWYPNK